MMNKTEKIILKRAELEGKEFIEKGASKSSVAFFITGIAKGVEMYKEEIGKENGVDFWKAMEKLTIKFIKNS